MLHTMPFVRAWRRASGRLLLAASMWFMLVGIAAATDSLPASAGSVAPDAQVARVAWMSGDAGLLAQGQGDWQKLEVNRPLTPGDRISTGEDARLELGLSDAALRLAGRTDMSLLAINDHQFRAALTQGRMELSLHGLLHGQEYEIDTPQVAVVLDRSARIGVDAGEGRTTWISVYQGQVTVYGEHGTQRVLQASGRYRFDDSSLATLTREQVQEEDAFHRWCRERDARHFAADSRDYVSDGTIGYADLDQYGSWQFEADYGHVWFPTRVARDWAPYRDGHWAWIEPWGWTWVSDAPWGFAPFHYGRWAMFSGRWGWVPGPVGVTAVYAPALVTFFGGRGWNVSIGMGARPVGWYPLGPGMFYDPWYRVGHRYYVVVNERNMRQRRHQHWDDRRRRLDQAYNAWRKPTRVARVRFDVHPPEGITIVSRHAMRSGAKVEHARLEHPLRAFPAAPVRPHGPEFAASRQQHILQVDQLRRLPVAGTNRPVVQRSGVVREPERVARVMGTTQPPRGAASGHTLDARSSTSIGHHTAPEAWAPPVQRMDRVRHVEAPQTAERSHRLARPVRPVHADELPAVPHLRSGQVDGSVHFRQPVTPVRSPEPTRVRSVHTGERELPSMIRHSPPRKPQRVDTLPNWRQPVSPQREAPVRPLREPAPRRAPVRDSAPVIRPAPRVTPPPVRAARSAHHAAPSRVAPVRVAPVKIERDRHTHRIRDRRSDDRLH